MRPRGAYATSKKAAEEALLSLAGDGFQPAILRQGTVYGYSPRMRFDLVVNTFVKDALIKGALSLHGGGWMWRPLVDVTDVARAHIHCLEAPVDQVGGEIFNVFHDNYQIRELAMLVAGSAQMRKFHVELKRRRCRRSRATTSARMPSCATKAGFEPQVSVLESIEGMLQWIEREGPDRLRPSALLQHRLDDAARGSERQPCRFPDCLLMKTLLIGANGQLGSDIVASWPADGLVALTHANIEVTDRASVAAAIGAHRPDLVINTSAFHNVDVCETEPERAFLVNAIAPMYVADACAEHGAAILHLSTDYVFSGTAGRAYTERDLPDAINVYGNAKAAGEQLIRTRHARHYIVRTSGLYGVAGFERQGGQLRRADARAREGGPGDPCRRRSDPVADAHCRPGGGVVRTGPHRPVRDVPHHERRLDLMARLRAGDLRACRR